MQLNKEIFWLILNIQYNKLCQLYANHKVSAGTANQYHFAEFLEICFIWFQISISYYPVLYNFTLFGYLSEFNFDFYRLFSLSIEIYNMSERINRPIDSNISKGIRIVQASELVTTKLDKIIMFTGYLSIKHNINYKY
jgi:hypothetical protein